MYTKFMDVGTTRLTECECDFVVHARSSSVLYHKSGWQTNMCSFDYFPYNSF